MNSLQNFLIILFLSVGLNFLKAETEETAETTSRAAASLATKNITTKQLWNGNDIDRLKRDLFNNYDKYSKPAPNPVVSLCTHPQVFDIDELQGLFKIYVWLSVKWQDNKLRWNPQEYGNITYLSFAAHEIWQPEIVSFNSIDPSSENYFATLIIAFDTGDMLWAPPHEFNVFCDMNFEMWPYDQQNCSLKLGTWASRDIKVVGNDADCLKSDIEDIFVNEWKHTKFATYKNRTDPITKYDYVEIIFEVERQSALYKTILKTSTSCIVLLILTGFWLPPNCGEKILINGVCAILIVAYLMYFGQLLPALADRTPFVVIFLSSSLLLTGISMIISVIVLLIADFNHEKLLPQWLRRILNGPVGKIFFLSHLNTAPTSISCYDEELKEDSMSSQDLQIFELSAPNQKPKKSIQSDWIVLATAIDRIFFIIYCIIFASLAIKYSV